MSALGDKLRSIPTALPARVAAAARGSVEAKAKASVPVRTGRLRDSIAAAASGPSIVVSSSVDYAQFAMPEDVDVAAEIDAAVGSIDAL
jgi:hypothetical protein